MTRFDKFFGLKAITITAALSMTAGLAFAGDNVSANQILDALRPKPATRGLSVGPQADPTAQAKEATFLNTVRNRSTRSLSMGEREQIAELAATKPKIDLEIQFDYNSADIAKNSVPSVQALGKFVQDRRDRGVVFRHGIAKRVEHAAKLNRRRSRRQRLANLGVEN